MSAESTIQNFQKRHGEKIFSKEEAIELMRIYAQQIVAHAVNRTHDPSAGCSGCEEIDNLLRTK